MKRTYYKSVDLFYLSTTLTSGNHLLEGRKSTVTEMITIGKIRLKK